MADRLTVRERVQALDEPGRIAASLNTLYQRHVPEKDLQGLIPGMTSQLRADRSWY